MLLGAPRRIKDIGALFDDWTHFETVLRLFRFQNQSQGDAYPGDAVFGGLQKFRIVQSWLRGNAARPRYLRSHYPVFYIKGALFKVRLEIDGGLKLS